MIFVRYALASELKSSSFRDKMKQGLFYASIPDILSYFYTCYFIENDMWVLTITLWGGIIYHDDFRNFYNFPI